MTDFQEYLSDRMQVFLEIAEGKRGIESWNDEMNKFLEDAELKNKQVVIRATDLLPKDEEDVLFFAFRYALGRRTGAVTLLVSQIKYKWERLHPATQRRIHDEIRRYPDWYGSLGNQCDIDSWQEILDLEPTKDI